MQQYFIINKPYLVLSQFTSAEAKKNLSDYYSFPVDVYPVGRLDYDSEGLLVLTNDTRLNHRLLDPAYQHEREYWVQVEGLVTGEALARLQQGVTISVSGMLYKTKRCKAVLLEDTSMVPERHPPIRFRRNIPTSWISITLTEGKNRQVRKMTAGVGFPTLRLIRFRIGNLTLGEMKPGGHVSLSRHELYGSLGIKPL